MDELPRDVQAALTRAMAAYLKATPVAQLPPSLRPIARFGARALTAHRSALWEALEDDGLRALVIEWLDSGKAPVGKRDEALLRVACDRPAGWAEELRARSLVAGKPQPAGDPSAEITAANERAQRARDDARRAREAARKSVAEERLRASEAERTAARLQSRLEETERALGERYEEIGSLRAELATERRTAQRELTRSRRAGEEARSELKEQRKEVARLRRALREAQERAAPSSRKGPRTAERRARPLSRSALPIPQGRPGDDPETLNEWLEAPRVHLLVDGYNVTKAEGGFGALDLRSQRERLTEEIAVLARRKGAGATLVFDGARQPPGRTRRRRLPISVEYSRPDEEADDHLVALLEALPPDPVVVVTNDRELQGRARALGGTIAGSAQLLALIRSGAARR